MLHPTFYSAAFHCTSLQAYGNERGVLGGLKIKNLQTGAESDLQVNGLFFAIGHKPATDFLEKQVGGVAGLGLAMTLARQERQDQMCQICIARGGAPLAFRP